MIYRFPAAMAFALFAALALPAAASPPVDVTPAVAARIDTALAAATGSTRGKTPALSVAVVENGRIVYARAFGVGDITARTPATTETRFRIASVTKMFTAVAVMQLVEAGRVRLDEPLATYLPDAPHAAEVTIRQLLTHTSGLWNYGDDAFATGRVATPTTPRAIIASLAQRPLDHKPGAAFSYSNTGYVLLGLVVEAVSHQTLADYEREHVFGPAKMTATTFGEAAPGAPAAQGYMDATGTAAIPYSPSWFYGDGDIVSTASDVARFDIALMDGTLVKPATFAEMQSSAVAAPELGRGVRYGLGLRLFSTGGATFVGHHGGVPGFEADNELLPAERYALVVLSDAFDFLTPAANAAVNRETLPAIIAQEAKDNATPSGPDDPVVTAKLRTFVTDLQRGTVDPAAVTAEVKAGFTPQVLTQLGEQLGAAGTLRTLTFKGKTSSQGLTAYRYNAAFAGGRTAVLTIVIDKDGKIAGFFVA
jgi:CubicO group peptidase (beta-lactamase class C family)